MELRGRDRSRTDRVILGGGGWKRMDKEKGATIKGGVIESKIQI